MLAWRRRRVGGGVYGDDLAGVVRVLRAVDLGDARLGGGRGRDHTRRRVETDEGDYTQLLPMRECAISAGLGTVAEAAYSVIQIVQKLEAMNHETSGNEEASLPAMLHTVSTLLEEARVVTTRRLQEANDTLQPQRPCSRIRCLVPSCTRPVGTCTCGQ